MTVRRTYGHLEKLRRKPNAYDIGTSELLYHVNRGFEVETPVANWHQRYQGASGLRATDWEQFADPEQTTYASYVERQRNKTIYIEGVLDAGWTADSRLHHVDWSAHLNQVLAVLRFPVHGLQMIASYLGSLAPSGRIVVVLGFQAADEIRRVQLLAQRAAMLRRTLPEFANGSRAVWQEDPLWQPFRRVLERLLVTYDWTEAFVAANIVTKPAFDELFMRSFGLLAEIHGDGISHSLLHSLYDDCLWQREWTRALIETLVEQVPENETIIARCIKKWLPSVLDAVEPFQRAWNTGAPRREPLAASAAELLTTYWQQVGQPSSERHQAGMDHEST